MPVFDIVDGGLRLPESDAAPAPDKQQGIGLGLSVMQRLSTDPDLKLQPHHAAGVVGNLATETGWFKNMQEIQPTVAGSRGGYGWAQWTGPRRQQFEAFARDKGLDINSEEANYQFLKQELLTTERPALEQLKQATNYQEASDAFMAGYERPGVAATGSRRRNARKLMMAFGSADIAPESPEAGPLDLQGFVPDGEVGAQVADAVAGKPDSGQPQTATPRPTQAPVEPPSLLQRGKNLLTDAGNAVEDFAYNQVMDPKSVVNNPGQTAKNLGSAALSGVYRGSEGVLGTLQAGAEATNKYLTGPVFNAFGVQDPVQQLAQTYSKARQGQKSIAERLTPKADSDLAAGVYSGMQSITQNLMTIPAAVVTGNPLMALGPMGVMTGGQSYGEARDAGKSPERAALYGTTQGIIEVGTEAIPMSKLLGSIKANDALWKTFAKQLVPEMLGEQAATFLQDLDKWVELNPDKTAKEFIAERPSAAMQTAVATLVGTGGQVLLGKAADAAAKRWSSENKIESLYNKNPMFMEILKNETDPNLAGMERAKQARDIMAQRLAAAATMPADQPEDTTISSTGIPGATDAQDPISASAPPAGQAGQAGSAEEIQPTPDPAATTPGLGSLKEQGYTLNDLGDGRIAILDPQGQTHSTFTDAQDALDAFEVPPTQEIANERQNQETSTAGQEGLLNATNPTGSIGSNVAGATAGTDLAPGAEPGTGVGTGDAGVRLESGQPDRDGGGVAPASAAVDPVGQPALTPILQNRTRSNPASVQQMQSIAGNPDYLRLSPSRNFAEGAPVIAGGTVPESQLGRKETTVTAKGRRIPVQYAVVEAGSVLASNNADGTVNAQYGDQTLQAPRAIAGNGRIAGLQKAYRQGSAQQYRADLEQDDLHGISPEVIQGMQNPVLVRLMPDPEITADIGDESNISGGLSLSPVEQAKNDAERLDLAGLDFDEDGTLGRNTVLQFVRSMPESEQGGLLDADGTPNRQAHDRLNSAVFQKAYDNEELVRLHSQAVDPEAKLVMSTLSRLAPKVSRLKGQGAFDVRPWLADAAKAIINGKRRDLTMQQIAEQQDLDIDPRAYDIIRLFADNPRSNKAVIEDLSDFADFTYNEATRDTTDMFGETPRATREDLVKRLENYRERRGQQNLAKRSRGKSVSSNPQEAATQPAGPDNLAETAQAQSGLFGEPTSADRANTDREALAEAQREGQRRRNANNAPPADDGLFAQDNRQDQIRFSRAPTFYSQLARGFDTAKQDSMPGSQWRAWLFSNQAKLGIKADEIAWTGIEDFLKLKGKEKTSKADIAAFLADNGVQVNEVIKGEQKPESIARLKQVLEQEDNLGYDRSTDAARDLVNGRLDIKDIDVSDDVRSEIAELVDDYKQNRPTKFSQYTIPGGENYRELLITLPERANAKEGWSVEENDDGLFVIRQPDGDLYRSSTTGGVLTWASERGANGAMAGYAKAKDQTSYRSSHWDEPNVLAHLRFDERQDADGNKVLFITELQSDWQQDARRKGVGVQYRVEKSNGAVVQSFATEADANAYAEKNWSPDNNISVRIKQGVPQGPFIGADPKPVVSLGIKRAIRYAAENGFDKIAFASGQQNADLYDLRRQVAGITWENTDKDNVLLQAKGFDDNYLINETMPSTRVDDYIGKELGDKIRSSIDRGIYSGGFSGEGLKVGGEGMRTFYDKIVPSVANEVLKKLGGGRVGTANISVIPAETYKGDSAYRYAAESFLEGGSSLDEAISGMEKAYPAAKKDEIAAAAKYVYGFQSEQPAFTITPAMREKVMGGLPLFRQARRAGQQKVGAVLGREAVERAATRIGRRLGLSANVSIRTVDTEAELPADIRQQAAKDGATGTVIAVHRGDEIFLVADQHKSLAQVEESILHESNHYGANALFGKAKRQAYTRLYFKLGRADGIRDLAAKQGVNMDAYFTTADELRKDGKISDTQRFSYLVDEFLAHVQGKKAYASLPQKIKTAIQEFYGAIRNWMNQRGFVKLAQFNDADLAYLLRSIHRAAQGNTKPGKGQAMFMVAWHGGPHDFDKFSTSKIGTGEGAQAFGYGLYFSSDKEVGEWYRDKLAGQQSTLLIDGKEFSNTQSEYSDASDVDRIIMDAYTGIGKGFKSQALLVSELRSRAKGAFKNWKPIFKEAIAKAKSEAVQVNTDKGKLYQVELAPAEDEYLDWHKPLSEQSEKVRRVIKKVRQFVEANEPSSGISIKPVRDDVLIGEGLYGSLSVVQGSDQAASEYLHSLGIRGIRYPAEGQTGGKTGDKMNYVIFSDDDVEITAKFSRGEPTEQQLQKEYEDTKARYESTPQWMKAPNGKSSKLTEQQWVMVRTPRFKAWFGDFEADKNQAMSPVVLAEDYFRGSVDDARAWAVKNLANSDGWLNKATGDKLIVSKRVMTHKATSGTAITKSDDARIHLAALHEMPAIIRVSVPVASEPDSGDDTNILGVHKFIAPLQYGDDLFAVKLTIKDHDDLPRGKHRKFYVHEIVDMEVMPVAAKYAGRSRSNPIVQSTGTGPALALPHKTSVGELIDAINAKEEGAIPAVSMVTDENGEPRVVHHGAPDLRFMADDATFKTLYERYGFGYREGAYWFASSKKTANSYADDRRAFDYQNAEPGVLDAFLNLRNPLEIDAGGKTWRDAQNLGKTSNVIEQARAGGHDGAIIRNVKDDYNNGRGTPTTTTYTVFTSNQIKSVDNRGTFGTDTGNILQEPLQDDLFRQQLDLFLDADPAGQSGPKTQAAKRAAAAAVESLRGSDRGVLGRRLADTYAARQRVSLVGHTVNSREDVATLAQVYRDPRFETFRLFFLDQQGKIVSQVGLSSRLPSSSAVIVGSDIDKYLTDLAKAASKAGAVSYYMLHNHPSTNPMPSNADVNLTKKFEQDLNLISNGHVIIDTNRYGYIYPDGNVAVYEKDFGQVSPYKANEYSSHTINNPATLMDVAKKIEVDNDAVTLIAVAASQKVLGVTTIPSSVIKDSSQSRRTLRIRKALKALNGAKAFAVGTDRTALMKMTGLVMDSIHINEDGDYSSLAEQIGAYGMSDPFVVRGRNVPRVTADTSPEFDYLREQTLLARGGGMGNGMMVAEPDAPFSSRKNVLGQTPLVNWTAPDEAKLDDWIYKLADKQIDTKRVVEKLNASDAWNPYQKETLYHGKAEYETNNFKVNEVKPLLDAMSTRGISIGDLETYLWNRHAPEANDYYARVNPDQFPDGGSGIKTQDALDYLANLPAGVRTDLEAIANQVDAILRETRALLVREGLETQETIDAWEAAYQHYIPLQRESAEISERGMGTGQGFSVKGPASKRRTGSGKAAADILAQVMMQRERVITRAEKNRVALSLYGLAIQNPNPGFWYAVNPDAITQPAKVAQELIDQGMLDTDIAGIIKEPTEARINPRTGLVEHKINPMLRNRPNVLAVRIKGKDRFLFFSTEDARAVRMAESLKNLDAADLGGVWNVFRTVTRYVSSINTQYNPIFGVVNLIRDTQGGMLNLSSTPLAGQQGKVMAGVGPALRGIYADLRADRKGQPRSGNAWSKLWEEFQQVGGKTGYRDMFRTAEDRGDALQKELQKAAEGKVKRFGRGVFDWLSDYNETLENAVRLSAYKAGIESGMTKDQSAVLAKDLTVNFNRKGQIASQMGSLYAFFNASAQGSVRLAQTLKGPAGKKIMAGGILLGVMQSVLMAMAGYDDDEPPEFVRERNFILPIGGGKYLTVPYPLGFHALPNMGRVVTDIALSGGRDGGKKVAGLLGSLFETFNPIGSAGWSVQTIAPTFADPLVALSENRDSFGKPIAKEDRSSLSPTPGFSRTKDTASVLSKKLAWGINRLSGGTDYTQGVISPTPDQLDFLFGQVTGGVGREVMKLEQAATSWMSGEELPPYKYPLGVGRFIGNTTAQASDSNRFYANLTRLNELEAELKGRTKEGEDVKGFMQDNPEASLVGMANAAETTVTKLRSMKRKMIAAKRPKAEVKQIETRIQSVMKSLNDRVRPMRDSSIERALRN
jgi:hypothetical protein